MPIPHRRLGRTGEAVSAIGLGGHHIGKPQDEQAAIRLIRAAIDGGITFLDNCWDYHDGKSEARMGQALRDGYRERVFLMTKIDGRTRAAAAKQIEESLSRLGTDRVDLMQLHEVIRHDDAARAFAAGGAIEALIAARDAGKVRYIGFTGHKSPAMHLSMLDAARSRGFAFDAVQLPLNVMDAHYDSFEQRVLPRLVAEEIGVLGMKPLGNPYVLESQTVDAATCLRYALTLPVSVVITGCETEHDLAQALAVAGEFRPLTAAEMEALRARTARAARGGTYERYKTTADFDSTAQHPEWLG